MPFSPFFTTEKSPMPVRGIIIVDTSALLKLCMPVDQSLQGKPAFSKNDDSDNRPKLRDWYDKDVPRYSDMLILLAQNGYKIKIPEMVAFEAGRTLRHGHQVDDIFHYKQKKHHEAYANAREFMKRVGHYKYPNIEIVSPSSQATVSDASKFIRNVRMILSKFLHAEHDHEITTEEFRDMRNNFIETNKSCKRNFGDMAAVDLANILENDGVPLFYLCQDKDAMDNMLKDVHRDSPVGRLNITGLLQAFSRQRLFSEAGIDHFGSMRQSVKNIVEVMNRQYNEILRKAGSATTSLIPDYYIDTTYLKEENKPNNLPFSNSMKGLGAQIRGESKNWAAKISDSDLSDGNLPPR